MNRTRFWTLTGIVLLAAVSRLAPHPENVTPVFALALFGAATYRGRIAAVLVPLAVLLVSDVLLQITRLFDDRMPGALDVFHFSIRQADPKLQLKGGAPSDRLIHHLQSERTVGGVDHLGKEPVRHFPGMRIVTKDPPLFRRPNQFARSDIPGPASGPANPLAFDHQSFAAT